MARHQRTANCMRCGRDFRLCCYNAHHQKYCTDASCVAERRRERQRNSYRQRYRSDHQFREAEQTRCRESIAQCRARCKAPPALPDTPPTPLNLEFFATGLLAQMIDSTDPDEVRNAARSLQLRGQRLAMAGQSTRGSPY